MPTDDAHPLDPAAWWKHEAFLRGTDLWNRRLFWEAHEAWEEPWRAAGRHSVAGHFLQGLILLAAAGVKHELGAAGPARRLAARGARRLREARDAGPRVDAPAFAAAVERWVAGALPAPPLLRLDPPAQRGDARGMTDADPANRSDILKSLAIPDEIRADMLALIGRSAGTVWQRPAIAPAQRSMLSISVLGALGRMEELRIHIGMGLDNGLSRQEICEVIMQLGIYAGMPAAIAAFRVATAVFEERT